MVAARIRAMRRALGETTGQFGARVQRSSRTVEGWEQGRTQPDALVRRILAALDVRVARRRAKRGQK